MINESVRIVANTLLNEMFIEGKAKLRDGAHILAYRSKIWVLGDQPEIESTRISNSIKKEAGGELTRMKGKVGIGDVTDGERPDILHGIVKFEKYGNKIHKTLEIINDANYQHNMDTSPLVKKVAMTLGADSVIFNDHMTGRTLQVGDTRDLKPGAPTWGYHGTSSEYLMSILKYGIRPRPDQTNFKNIEHEDTIFLTLDPNKAIFHATQAIDKDRSGKMTRVRNDYDANKYNAIILRVKIPDPNLLTADYDIDTEASQDLYVDTRNQVDQGHLARRRGIMPGDSEKLSQHLGVFGYKGSILPQQITDVYVAGKLDDSEPPTFDLFTSFKPSEVRETMARFAEVGYDIDEMGELGIDLREALNHPDMFLDEIQNREDEDA